MTDIAIYGASGLGRLVHDTLVQAEVGRVVGFLDSNTARHGESLDGLPILGGLPMAELLARRRVGIVVAIGENHARLNVAARLRAAGVQLASAIHPLASIAPSARLGGHVFIGPRAIVCVHARIGDDAIVSAGAIVEHDNDVGRGAFLHAAVRLAGGVRVGLGAALGVGASVVPGRSVGDWAVVEPGSIVIRDVPPAARVSGVPARATALPHVPSAHPPITLAHADVT